MTYRTTPEPTPLITYLGGMLLALDPTTGDLLWQTPCLHPERVLVVGRTVFTAAPSGSSTGDPSQIQWFDIGSGRAIDTFDAGFQVRAALAHGDCAYFAGRRGLLAMRADGSVVFHARTEEGSSSFLTTATDLVMCDGDGNECFRLPCAEDFEHDDGLLVVGDAAAQRDLDTT